jgi:hypothetical protein
MERNCSMIVLYYSFKAYTYDLASFSFFILEGIDFFKNNFSLQIIQNIQCFLNINISLDNLAISPFFL